MVFIIQEANWCSAIGDAIRSAKDGDTIVVDTAMKAKLVEKARSVQCPSKQLTIEIGGTARHAIA